MSRIFGYVGKEDCRFNLLSALHLWNGESVGIVCKAGDDFVSAKELGNASKIADSINEIGQDCTIGLAQSTVHYRVRASRMTIAPASNSDFALAFDGRVDNFDYLKKQVSSPYPILTDEDLMLNLLCASNCENNTDALLWLDSMLVGNPTYAFFSKNDDAIFCKKGNAPLYVGIAKSGYFVSSELGAMDDLALRYFALNDGEYARVTSDRIAIFDAKRKRIKRSALPMPRATVGMNDYPLSDEVFYCSLAVKSVANAFVKDGRLDMNELKFSRHIIDKISRIVITGVGNDYYSALLGAHSFLQFTDIPACAIPSGELKNSPISFDKNMLLIAVSNDGENMDTITTVKRAKSAGARVLAITSSPLSYLADLADIIVNPLGEFDSNIVSLRGFISEYLVLSLLALNIGEKTKVVSNLYLSVVLKMLESLSGKVTSSVKSSPQLDLASSIIKSAHRIVTTGFLGDYALALEASSRLRSIAQISSSACQLDELENTFARGIEGALVIAFVSDDRWLQDNLFYLRRARSLGANVLIFTATNIEEEIKDFDSIVSINDSIPVLNPVPIISAFYKTAIILSDDESSQNAV